MSKAEQGVLARWAYWCGWERVWSGTKAASRTSAVNYGVYTLSVRELLLFALIGCGGLFGGAYIFYHSVWVAGLTGLLGLAAPRYGRALLLDRRKKQLKLQFKEALFSLTSSLAAGRSIENAFRSSLEDLHMLFGDSKSDIIAEFTVICRRLDNGEPLEAALRHFAERAHSEEITQFADVIGACKRSGGDLVEVMRRTATVIGEKLTVESDIMVLIAQKKLESRIMMAVPFVFMGFLSFAAPGLYDASLQRHRLCFTDGGLGIAALLLLGNGKADDI